MRDVAFQVGIISQARLRAPASICPLRTTARPSFDLGTLDSGRRPFTREQAYTHWLRLGEHVQVPSNIALNKRFQSVVLHPPPLPP